LAVLEVSMVRPQAVMALLNWVCDSERGGPGGIGIDRGEIDVAELLQFMMMIWLRGFAGARWPAFRADGDGADHADEADARITAAIITSTMVNPFDRFDELTAASRVAAI